MLKRACLYLRRRYKRSMLLFLLMFLISLSLSVGLSAWKSIDAVTKEIEQRLSTSFVFKVPATLNTEDVTYYRPVTTTGAGSKAYCGPTLNQDFAEQIMQVDGIRAYNGEIYSVICIDDLELSPCMASVTYNQALNDTEKMNALLSRKDQIGSLEYYEIRCQESAIYGNTDTSLLNKFRTGAFELVEGRHIQPDDRQKVLISDYLAEKNNLDIGDTIHTSLRNIDIGVYKDPKQILDSIQFEIIGIFHVNGYQPTGEFISADEITYNWLLADENTVAQIKELRNEHYYLDFVPEVNYENLTFFVDEPARLNEIMEEVKQLDVENIDFFDLSLDDTMYKSTVEPLNSIRNLITGMMVALAVGCVIVLLIVFTLWVRDRRKEIAIYISMGLEKASIVGQLLLEAVIITAIAFAVAFPISQPLTDYAGNTMLAASIEAAQPDDTPKEYSLDELRQAALSGRMDELFSYETSTYSGPEQIDFSLGAPELAALAALELLIIAGAICKGSMFLFRMAPKQILTDLR